MEKLLGGIERGRVAEATAAGYIVESLDRKGIVSPPITPAGESEYAQGDLVLFVLFRDGTGKIICEA